LRRARHLRRHPAQGRHAELRHDRRDQQRHERADLRVQRPRRRRRPARDRAEADRARPPAARMSRPSNFPPPFSTRDYVAEPTDPADERIEVGVLIVGAGPAGLACAIRLGQLLEKHPDVAERLGDVPVAVLEKGKQPGSHLLSGAVVDPRALRRVVGVRSGDKGRGREGGELANFEVGSDLVAKVTVLAEGTQGHLTGVALDRFTLRGEDPQVWELGVKEVWKVAKPLDRVIHTMGWPLRTGKRYREFGGSFIYPLGKEMVTIGLVVGLDYRDASLAVHDRLQELKTHPKIRRILAGGERVEWGAKTIPSGGFHSLPRQLHAPGLLLCGDGAGMVNIPRLKGVHYAIESGRLAAEAAFRALQRGETPASALSSYDDAVRDSFIWRDLYEVRNMRQVFGHGFFVGGALASAMTVSKGRVELGKMPAEPDADQPLLATDRDAGYPAPDGQLTFDKLSSVFASGNKTRDDQPNHIRIERRVPREVAQLWAHMCPAQVYEIGREESDGTVVVELAPSNCVQCGAITAKGGRLTPPEGGSGPE